MLYNYKGIHLKRNIETLDFMQREYLANEVEMTAFFPKSESELVYVANEEDEEQNRLFEHHLGFINKVAAHFDLHVIYIPTLVKQLSSEEIQRYRIPYKESKDIRGTVGNDYLLRYLVNPDKRTDFQHGLVWIINKWDTEDGELAMINEFFPLFTNDKKSIAQQLLEVFLLVHHKKNKRICYYTEDSCDKRSIAHEDYADEHFNSQHYEESINDLMDEIRERVEKLRQRGIAEHILTELLHPLDKLSQMIITKEYRIFLPDYQSMEIKMEPLIKAVYFLFLKHPEGLMFKDLPDYREELTEIYLQLKPNGLTDKVRKSIEDVTNPLMNSINEKCARIRGAFIQNFDEHLAHYYYIDGLRAMPKTIALPRELVVWE
jgi:hypothetical protein